MRICFLIHAITSGGAERTVSYLCNNFAEKLECDVDLVQFQNSLPFYDISNKVNKVYLTNKKSEKAIVKKIYIELIRMFNFRKYCKKYKPDVIVCLMHLTKTVALIKPRNIPIILSERYDPAAPRSRAYKFIRKWYYNSSQGVIFQTKRAKDYYIEHILKDKDKGVVIQNAIGNPYACSTNALETAKENKISAVARLNEEKNYPLLINAFKNVVKIHPEYKLEIYGQGPLKDELQKLINDYNLQNNIFLMGAHKDALTKIASSKCYVLSSNHEGLPNSLMEAMAIGLPCVSTDCPNGPSELIINGENGLLVPVNDESALTNAILKMIEDREFANDCAENARKILETNNIDAISKKFYDYICEVANKCN